MKLLFVYGTLRPGEPNYSIVQSAVVAATPATALGRLYHVTGGTDLLPRYPVADFYTGGLVHGEVLVLEDDPEVWELVQYMEVRSGYVEREVPVVVASGRALMAVTYHWPHTTRGDEIPSGDWRDVRALQDLRRRGGSPW